MQQGDEQAALQIYRSLVSKVFGFCMQRVSDRALAEDLTQDIFLKLTRSILTFDPDQGSFLVWFWQIARNTITDHYRKRRDTVFSDVLNEDTLSTIPSHDTAHLFTALAHKDVLQKIEYALQSFSLEDQELFRLRYLSELSYEEIAQLLHKTPGALRVQVNRLKKKIFSVLHNEHDVF